jgi:uncharacterized protein YbaR (Trm112 family)
VNTFKTIAIFSYPAEAVVVKGKIESEGITVFLKDEFTVATDPFATNAIGGVKMQVYKEDYLKAMGILETSNPELVKYRTEYIVCPACNRRNTRETLDVTTARNLNEILTAVFYSLFPLKQKHNYHCRSCNAKFNINE